MITIKPSHHDFFMPLKPICLPLSRATQPLFIAVCPVGENGA